ncbi:MAG: roadblock/LC7 domain-containing protein [Candidatus Eisenbacteria bacterium]|nr:roadblock/LC7 domain-containing protein [Candidatus Eisenbacteria bacterium]
MVNRALYEEDIGSINAILKELLETSFAQGALLVDNAGQLILNAGTTPDFDLHAFASLVAADFAANSELARLLGEDGFNTLVHQGGREHLYLTRVNARVILAAVFDKRTSLGLVRLRVKRCVSDLRDCFQRLFDRRQQSISEAPVIDPALVHGMESELERAFGG